MTLEIHLVDCEEMPTIQDVLKMLPEGEHYMVFENSLGVGGEENRTLDPFILYANLVMNVPYFRSVMYAHRFMHRELNGIFEEVKQGGLI